MGNLSGPLKISSVDFRYVLLEQAFTSPDNTTIKITTKTTDVLDFLQRHSNEVIAFDTETNSVRIFGNPKFKAVGIGFSCNHESIYLDYSRRDFNTIQKSLTKIRELKPKLLAFNLAFDASVISFYLGGVRPEEGGWLRYSDDAYYLLRMFSSEGWDGQRFDLKSAMRDLLSWRDTNEYERDEWLISRGYVSGAMGIKSTSTPEQAAAIKERIRIGRLEGKHYKPAKGEMHRVPAKILGKYCCLDSYATWLLYKEVLLPVVEKFTSPFYEEWFKPSYLMHIRNAVDNYRHGIKIDRSLLEVFIKDTAKAVEKTSRQIEIDFKKEIREINTLKLRKFKEKHIPAQLYKKAKERKEPVKYTKKGQLNKQWTKWKYLTSKVDIEPIPTANYLSFLRKVERLKAVHRGRLPITTTVDKTFSFNLNSVADKIHLLFGTDGEYHEVIKPCTGTEWNERGTIRLLCNEVELDMTKSGQLPTGKSTLLAFGKRTKSFIDANKVIKQLQFAVKCRSMLTKDNFLHISFKVPGTLTIRNSGAGGLNLQNLPKVIGYLQCWIPRNDSYLISQADFKSLEPAVLAEASKDETLWELFGPDASPYADVYIHTAVKMGGALGRPFIDGGYNPKNPDKDIVSKLKKEFKELRNAAKVIKLQSDYGAGAPKKWQTLRIYGFKYTKQQVKVLDEDFWIAYAGIKKFGELLKEEWELNKGFILDGFGFPICVDKSKKRDLINRYCQRSGHVALQLFLYLFTKELWKNKIDYHWMIYDYHDEIIPEIRKEQIHQVHEIAARCLHRLNTELLGAEIPLQMPPQVAGSLAEIKIEGYKNEDQAIVDLIEQLMEDE
jgi:hypothetical protein